MDTEKTTNTQEEQIIQVDFRDVVNVANGTDDGGQPNSAASLAIYKVEGDQMLADQEVAFSNAVTNMFFSGGCMVVQVDFPSSAQYESRRAAQIAADWMGKMNTDEYNNKLLSFIVVPLKLMGQIYLMFSELVYFTTFRVAQNETRLVMCFDNTATQTFETEDIDIHAITARIEQELRDQENALENEAMDLQEQIKKLQEYNPYEEMIKEKYSSVDDVNDIQKDGRKETFHRPGYRFDYEENGEGEDDEDERNDP